MKTYRVMCQYAMQASIAYVGAENEQQAIAKCMALYGVKKAYVLGITDAESDF